MESKRVCESMGIYIETVLDWEKKELKAKENFEKYAGRRKKEIIAF